MKKLILLSALFILASGAFAQENLVDEINEHKQSVKEDRERQSNTIVVWEFDKGEGAAEFIAKIRPAELSDKQREWEAAHLNSGYDILAVIGRDYVTAIAITGATSRKEVDYKDTYGKAMSIGEMIRLLSIPNFSKFEKYRSQNSDACFTYKGKEFNDRASFVEHLEELAARYPDKSAEFKQLADYYPDEIKGAVAFVYDTMVGMNYKGYSAFFYVDVLYPSGTVDGGVVKIR